MINIEKNKNIDGKMKEEKTETKNKNIFERLKEPKFIVCEALGIALIVIFLFLSNNSVCADSSFIYENVNVPAKLCLTKNIQYNDGGVIKNAAFTEEFIKSLKISK